MMEETSNVGMIVSSSEETRKGAYANLASIRTSRKENVLDFIFVESETVDEKGARHLNGILQSRIILTNESLFELKRMLDSHIEKNFGKDE